MCHVSLFSSFFFFSGQRGEAYRQRVCYQRGLPRLVISGTAWSFMPLDKYEIIMFIVRFILIPQNLESLAHVSLCPPLDRQKKLARPSLEPPIFSFSKVPIQKLFYECLRFRDCWSLPIQHKLGLKPPKGTVPLRLVCNIDTLPMDSMPLPLWCGSLEAFEVKDIGWLVTASRCCRHSPSTS